MQLNLWAHFTNGLKHTLSSTEVSGISHILKYLLKSLIAAFRHKKMPYIFFSIIHQEEKFSIHIVKCVLKTSTEIC